MLVMLSMIGKKLGCAWKLLLIEGATEAQEAR